LTRTGDERAELLERAVHDLKNPLAVVRASLEWLEVELVDRPDALDTVRDSAIACQRLVRIADDLEILARLETGGLTDPGPVAVNALLGSLKSVCSAPRGGSLVVESKADPLVVDGDLALLARALEALVDACVRGARAGSIVEIVATREGADVAIIVAARGAVDASTPEASIRALANAGLGVYVALRIAAAHGGGLTVVATDSAARATFRVPADAAPAGAAPARDG